VAYIAPVPVNQLQMGEEAETTFRVIDKTLNAVCDEYEL